MSRPCPPLVWPTFVHVVLQWDNKLLPRLKQLHGLRDCPATGPGKNALCDVERRDGDAGCRVDLLVKLTPDRFLNHVLTLLAITMSVNIQRMRLCDSDPMIPIPPTGTHKTLIIYVTMESIEGIDSD